MKEAFAVHRAFNLKPLYAAIVPLLMGAPAAHAAIVDHGNSLTIDDTTPIDGYTVRNASTLIVNGATTRSLFIQSASNVQISGGTVQGGIFPGLSVTNASATVDNSLIESDVLGVSINRQPSATTGSQAFINNSRISGGEIGAQVTGASRLSLVNTQVHGTGVGSTGVNLLGGALEATGGTISGDASGVRLASDGEGTGNSSAVLDGTTVEGRSGAALLVEDGAQASITVRNGTRLIGADGTLLQVREASTAQVDLNNVDLEGAVRVEAGSSADVTLQQARWNGAFEVEAGGNGKLNLNNQSHFTGRLANVEQLSIGGQSSYTLTEDTQVGSLTLNDGTVNMGSGSQFFTLDLQSLAGSGVFAMNVDFATNAHDTLVVSGNATGSHQLLVADSGKDPLSPEQLTLVHTGQGDASFSLYNDRPVAVGAWAYGLESRQDGSGGTEWYLDPEKRTVSPGTRSVMALFNTAPTVWYGELTSLRSRMGELRFNGGKPGVWMRTYGNRYNVADGSGTGYQQNQHGVSFGADGRLPWGDGQWLAGGMLGYSKSDLDLDEGTSGSVDSYYLGAYTTWLDAESGYYFDGVAKFNRFQNKAKVAVNDGSHAKGDYDNLGLGVSAEFGRHLALDDGYFVEPFTQWSAVVIQGKDFSLSNDLQADGDRTRSLLGKAGVTGGRTFDLQGGGKLQPYLRAALAHEFAKGNDVHVNNNRFNNDLSGSRGELGAGVALQLAGGLQVHLDLEYVNGKHIEQPYGANVGVRYDF